MSLHLNQTAPGLWEGLRRAGAGLAAGGMLLLIMYAIEISFGLIHGRFYTTSDLPGSGLAWGGFIFFSLGLLTLAIGLFTLSWSLRPRAPVLATLSMALAAVAFVLMPLNLAFLLGIFGTPRHVPALTIPILTNLAATTLLASAALRSRALPTRSGLALLLAGVITFPFILLTIPLEQVIPEYVIADLPFAAWGLTFLIVGLHMARAPLRQA